MQAYIETKERGLPLELFLKILSYIEDLSSIKYTPSL